MVYFVRNSRFFLLSLPCVGLGFLLFFFRSFFSSADVTVGEGLVIGHLEAETPQVERIEQVIQRNSTLQEILLNVGFTAGEIHSLVQDVRPVYDLNRVVSGHRFVIERFADGTLHNLEYHIDDEEYLLVRSELDQYIASRKKHDFQVVVEEFYGEVDRSLWDTLVSQGETAQLVLALHQILQWDVDFTAIQPRDSFKLIVEKKYLDGEFVTYGRVLAVQFISGARTFDAFLFENPKSGEPSYYDRKGNAVRKAFLKAPFHFDPRITSSFSYSRYHPILKRRRPHLGVDYGAPVGTSVLASASGTVIFVGRDGGYGKLVKIRHPNGYVTSYAHLSRIDVRRGQRVKQGEQIGRVGSTGLSTGPHLDYRVQDKNRRYINPQKVTALPSDKAVEQQYFDQFVSIRDELMQRLAFIPESAPYLNRISQAD